MISFILMRVAVAGGGKVTRLYKTLFSFRAACSNILEMQDKRFDVEVVLVFQGLVGVQTRLGACRVTMYYRPSLG